MTERILIQFPPGCYGHFIYWCIKYFSTTAEVPLPFESTGSSHGIREDNKFYHFGLTSSNYNDIHKQTKQKVWLSHETFDDNDLIKDFDHIIILHSMAHPLWAANNAWTKSNIKPTESLEAYESQRQWMHDNTGHGDLFFPLWTSDNWDKLRIWCKISINPWTDNDMEIWQLREKLSFFDQTNILAYAPLMKNASLDHSMVIDILLIKEAFTLTIQRIMQFLNKPILKNNFDMVYESWIKQQVHSNKDNMINDICNNVETDKDFAFDQPLTCLDEIGIQHALRSQGYEIECDGLNVFPKTMYELREITYKA